MKITRKAFEEWLRKHYRKNEFVGYGAEADNCPIATYFSEEYPHMEFIAVNGASVEYMSEKTGRWYLPMLPKWCHKFVVKVDDNYEHEPVGARQALKIFRSV